MSFLADSLIRMTTHYYLNENFTFLQFSNSTNYLVKKSVSNLLPCSISYMESVGDAQPFFLFYSYFPLLSLYVLTWDFRTIYLSNFRYSQKTDIQRARTYFLQGKRPFLLFTERFYFFYRYIHCKLILTRINFCFTNTERGTCNWD